MEKELTARDRTIDEMFKRPPLGPDDRFRFWCTACGDCCTDVEGLMLEPGDIYRAAKYLGIEPVDFINGYCTWYIGEGSMLPIITPRTTGKDRRCIFLENKKCRIHPAKPCICEIYPLGRVLEGKDCDRVEYRFVPVKCGKRCREFTVRQWLSNTGVEESNRLFIEWHKAIGRICPKLHEVIEKHGRRYLDDIAKSVLVFLYANYTTDEEFLPQFEKNVDSVLEFLGDADREMDAAKKED